MVASTINPSCEPSRGSEPREGFIENELSPTIPLDGAWQFRLGDGAWRRIRVPSAWEASTHDKLTEGPAVYRRRFRLAPSPQPSPNGRGWRSGEGSWILECDAVSFAATVKINEQVAGAHTGMWSGWQLDVTPYVRAGENEIEIEVWKPGETRYKLRESLAGFLPDVYNTFGGIWQGIRIRHVSGPAFADVRVTVMADGRVRVCGRCVGTERAVYDVRCAIVTTYPERSALGIGVKAAKQNARAVEGRARCRGGAFDLGIDLPKILDSRLRGNDAVTLWRPTQPALYELILTLVRDGKALAKASRRIGFRNISAEQDKTLLNGVPVHLRGVLDWGWDELQLRPTPSRVAVRRMFRKARALGFNLWKLCLFVPDAATFDVADEEGMLLWLELPMWLPVVTLALEALALREYEAILRRVHHHPSIVIVSLGCELNGAVPADFLHALRAMVRKWLPNALLCENSGSSEAYAGTAGAAYGGDFYDYHFYADLHDFRPLVQHFDRRYQPGKPWIYGEFCDADTMRDWSMLGVGTRPSTRAQDGASLPFWAKAPATMQRDELRWAREHQQRLKSAGIRDGGARLTHIARKQATVIRKFVFEQTRRERATGGYVVTGWKDTPIATSGVVDDRGALKFDPAEWRQFNAGRVLVMDRERRRVWMHGGDRPVHRDPSCWWSDEPIELHLVLSNGGEEVRGVEVRWSFTEAEAVVGAGFTPAQRAREGRAYSTIGAGEVAELARVTLPARSVLRPTQFLFAASLVSGRSTIGTNAWPIWVLPRVARVDGGTSLDSVRHGLSDAVIEEVARGARVLVWLREHDECVTRQMPFWREAIHVFTPRLERMAALGPLPYADLRFYGVASDFAIDPDAIRTRLARWGVKITPLWRRFDARRMVWHDYVQDVRIGDGLLRLTTVRFAGGLGDQPDTLATNPVGSWLLHRLSFAHNAN